MPHSPSLFLSLAFINTAVFSLYLVVLRFVSFFSFHQISFSIFCLNTYIRIKCIKRYTPIFDRNQYTGKIYVLVSPTECYYKYTSISYIFTAAKHNIMQHTFPHLSFSLMGVLQHFDRIGTHTVVNDICRMSELCFVKVRTHA